MLQQTLQDSQASDEKPVRYGTVQYHSAVHHNTVQVTIRTSTTRMVDMIARVLGFTVRVLSLFVAAASPNIHWQPNQNYSNKHTLFEVPDSIQALLLVLVTMGSNNINTLTCSSSTKHSTPQHSTAWRSHLQICTARHILTAHLCQHPCTALTVPAVGWLFCLHLRR